MYDKSLKALQEISQAVGNEPDYVQGGGGNTSVKLTENLMAVKASGCKLSQITPTEGFVVVDYQKIKKYYEQVDLAADIDYEKESVAFVQKNIIEMEGIKTLRPSVEAGFHSLLKKCVIHSHSVYANILCCIQNGEELVKEIFKDKPYECIWIPYINPGFTLTLKIQEAIKKALETKGFFPKVVFMENHGLIVSEEDSSACISLHKEVNDTIKEHFNINEPYPEVKLEETASDTFVSKTDYLVEFFKKSDIDNDFFEQALSPDQLVYLYGNVSLGGLGNQMNINPTTGEIVYKTNKAQAHTMEETMLSVVYVISQIKNSDLELKTMSEEQIDFIKNWESEKYRKKMVK